jgi:hypothetical protein
MAVRHFLHLPIHRVICEAKNFLKIASANRLLVPTIEIAGWRE